jgi:MFS family permease
MLRRFAPRKKIFYGWWIVLACVVLNFFAGGAFVYGFTIFFNPIRDNFGWSAAITSVAFVFQRLEMGVLGPLAGFLVDRVGPRKLMFVGWSIISIGFFLMSQINSLWTFYGAFLFMAMGFSFGSFVVMNTAVAHWFERKRSRALTVIYLGFGASGTLVPLIAMSIDKLGWRESLVCLAVVLGVAGLLLSSVMRHKPEPYGYLPDGKSSSEAQASADVSDKLPANRIDTVASGSVATGFTTREALRTRAFWLLSGAFLFQHIGTSAVMVHIVPYLESVNVSTAIAATAVTGMTLCSVIGRLGFGFLGDFANKRYLVAIALTLQTIGLFIFSLVTVDRTWLIVIFLLTYAPGYGGPIPLRPALQADYFGTRAFGTVMGLMASVSMAGGLFSPVFAGWIFDVTGSYRLAWQLFALITVPSVALILLAKPPQTSPEPS